MILKAFPSAARTTNSCRCRSHLRGHLADTARSQRILSASATRRLEHGSFPSPRTSAKSTSVTPSGSLARTVELADVQLMSSQRDASAGKCVRKNCNGLRSCVRSVVGKLRKRCQKPRINVTLRRWGKCGARPARASGDARCGIPNDPATARVWTVGRRDSAAAPQASGCALRVARTTNASMCPWSAREIHGEARQRWRPVRVRVRSANSLRSQTAG